MRLIRPLRRWWLAKGAVRDLKRACFYGARAVDRLAAARGLAPIVTVTASGVPAVGSYRVRLAGR